MRVLHAALMSQLQTGVVQQMHWENEAARRAGLDWDARIFAPHSLAVDDDPLWVPHATGDDFLAAGGWVARMNAWVSWRRAFYRWVQEEAVGRADVILLRYTPNDPFRARALVRIPVPVVSIHHTLETDEMRLSGANRLSIQIERTLGPRALRASDGVAAVTREILGYEQQRAGLVALPSAVYPNGALMDALPEGELPAVEVPHLLFVADRFQAWQGLDLLLDSLAACDEDFVLHLVGQLGEQEVLAAARDTRVTAHGRLSPAEIRALSQTCVVGVSSLALWRKEMEEACTLKVREYLSQGLPVYSGHRDVFPVDFDYYRQGSADIRDALAFARSMRGTARAEVARASHPYIAKERLLANIYGWMLEEFGPDGGVAA